MSASNDNSLCEHKIGDRATRIIKLKFVSAFRKLILFGIKFGDKIVFVLSEKK